MGGVKSLVHTVCTCSVSYPRVSGDLETSGPCQSIPGFPSNCDYPGIIPGCTDVHIPLPPCQSITGFPSNCDYPGIIPGCTHIYIPLPPCQSILGSSRDVHTYAYSYPHVRVSWDSLVTNCDYPGIILECTHIPIPLPPCRSIPGFPSNGDYPRMYVHVHTHTHILIPHAQTHTFLLLLLSQSI